MNYPWLKTKEYAVEITQRRKWKPYLIWKENASVPFSWKGWVPGSLLGELLAQKGEFSRYTFRPPTATLAGISSLTPCGIALACMAFMDHNLNPMLLAETAPQIIHDLRLAFEERMLGIYKNLHGIPVVYTSDGLEKTSHVHFTHGTLDVAAVFSHVQGRFTQLIARDGSEHTAERPSYTISIFL
jgi:hypothetical protein